MASQKKIAQSAHPALAHPLAVEQNQTNAVRRWPGVKGADPIFICASKAKAFYGPALALLRPNVLAGP